MKKTLIWLFVLWLSLVPFISACTKSEKENTMIAYETGIYYNKNWSDNIGTYTEDVISDKDTALSIARIIFNGMKKSKEAEEYIPKSVFYDEQDKIWIVSFSRETDEIIVGGDCNIAIQAKDGKVVRIWFGE